MSTVSGWKATEDHLIPVNAQVRYRLVREVHTLPIPAPDDAAPTPEERGQAFVGALGSALYPHLTRRHLRLLLASLHQEYLDAHSSVDGNPPPPPQSEVVAAKLDVSAGAQLRLYLATEDRSLDEFVAFVGKAADEPDVDAPLRLFANSLVALIAPAMSEAAWEVLLKAGQAEVEAARQLRLAHTR